LAGESDVDQKIEAVTKLEADVLQASLTVILRGLNSA
jgi:hypothetical protein